MVIDTETTGLHRTARMVELAWIVYDTNGEQLGSAQSLLIAPNGFIIPKDSEAIHKISTEMALTYGNPIRTVLERFTTALLDGVGTIVAYNADFDLRVLQYELDMGKMTETRRHLDKCDIHCAMKMTQKHLKLQKRVSLEYAYEHFCGGNPADISRSHEAREDAVKCAKIYFDLMKRTKGI